MTVAAGVRADSVVDEWLMARLNGDATLRSILNVPTGGSRVASMVAPSAWRDGPFVVFAMQLPLRTVRATLGGARVFADGEYLVRSVGRPADWGTIKSAADRLDILLDRATGTTSTGEVYTCLHVEPFRMEENDAPERPGDRRNVWLHVGALWRLQVG